MSMTNFITSFFLAVLLISSNACQKEAARSNSSSDADDPQKDPDTSDDCKLLRLLDDGVETQDDDIDVVGAGAEGGTTDPVEAGDEEGSDVEDVIKNTSDCGKEPSNSNTPTDTNNGTSWNPGPGIEGCKALGKVWIAVSNGGPGVCGEDLVKWCCTETNIKGKYPGLADKLQAAFDTKRGLGLTLYGCEKTASGTSVHYFKSSSKSWAKTTIPGEPFNSPEPASCKEVTSEDLGVTLGAGDDDKKVGFTGKLGNIDDISPAGIIKFLSVDKGHQQFPDQPAISKDGGTAHGDFTKYKLYFNEIMKNSLVLEDAEQPIGSIVVRELLDGDDVKGYAVRMKIKAGKDEDSWGYYQILSDEDGKYPDEPGTYAAGGDDKADACVECHKAGDDYTVSKLP